MAPEQRIFGAQRVILYLPAAVKTLHDLDGAREKGIKTSAEKFLNSPESAFDKHPKEFVSHVRNLNTNTRAFGTWCQNRTVDSELCVVQDIYRKTNEDAFWRDIDDYNDQGKDYFGKFKQLDKVSYQEWLDKVSNDSSTKVVKSSDK